MVQRQAWRVLGGIVRVARAGGRLPQDVGRPQEVLGEREHLPGVPGDLPVPLDRTESGVLLAELHHLSCPRSRVSQGVRVGATAVEMADEPVDRAGVADPHVELGSGCEHLRVLVADHAVLDRPGEGDVVPHLRRLPVEDGEQVVEAGRQMPRILVHRLRQQRGLLALVVDQCAAAGDHLQGDGLPVPGSGKVVAQVVVDVAEGDKDEGGGTSQ